MALIKDYSQRKVSISMAFVLVAVFGLISLFELPVELFPPIDQPVFQVKADYNVNNYKIIEQNITKPLERSLSSLDGVIFTESVSLPNQTVITVYLDWQSDITAVLLQAREKIDQARLPRKAERPLLVKKDPSRFPVFSYVVKGRSVEVLSGLVENHLGRVFDQIDGIAEAEFVGTRERRIIVVPDENRMKEYGVSFAEIESAFNALPEPTGGSRIRDGFREWSLRITDYITSIDDIKQIKLMQRNGRYIYVNDISEVRYDFERIDQFVVNGSEQGVLVHLIKESKANLIASADNVYEQIEKLRKFYPDLQFIPIFDGAKEIKSAINQLVMALLLGGVLSFLILIFFFKSLRVPFYLAIIIPVSILGTFIGCWFFNVSFNLISLGGLGLGIGMLIDNGIIITEYVKQRSHKGVNTAVHESIKMLWLPMLTSTLTSLSVFLPLLTVGGMSSVLFKQQAITISLSLGWAYVTAITLLPLLIIVFPPKFDEEESFKNRNWTLKAFRNPKMSYGILAALLVVLPVSIYFMDKRLLPEGTSSKLIAAYEVDPLINHDRLLQQAETLNQKLIQNHFEPVIYLTDKKEFSANRWLTVEVPLENDTHRQTVETLVKQAFEGSWEIKYEKALLRQIVDERQDYHTINVKMAAPEQRKKLRTLLEPYKNDVEIIGNDKRLFLVLELKREKLMQYNIPLNTFVSFLETKLNGNEINEVKSFNRTDKVYFTGNFDNRIDLNRFIESQFLLNQNFYKVNEFLNWRIEEQDHWAISINQAEIVMLRKSVYDTESAKFMETLSKKLNDENFVLETDITTFRINQTNAQLGLSLIFSLILILFILAVQFESIKHPLLIVSIVPISFSGAFVTLWALGESVNVIALTGLVILMGIVINDTILKIDAIRYQRLNGRSLLRSILKGSHSRLRPIILTTLSTIVASIPLLFGNEGIELRKPIAIVLIAGMAFSTYLTIQVVPLLYYNLIKKEN